MALRPDTTLQVPAGEKNVASADKPSTIATVLLPPSSSRPADPLARAYDLPFTLVLEVPAVDFTVGSLMRLQPGCIVRTSAQHNEDISLKVNGQIVGLVEFDVLGDNLAVRITGVV